jgi:cytochrome c oxidase assembly factor CtaG
MKYAWAALAVFTGGAVVSAPFDRLSDASFAWHMVQHLVLFFALPLFLLLARPFELVAALTGKARTAAAVRALRPLHVAALPPVALATTIAVWWGTHFSGLYEASLEHWYVHALEHAAYATAGVAFWLPVLGTPPLRPQSYPVRLLYVLLALPQGALLAVALGAGRTPLYAHYAAAMSPSAALADQQHAAAVMWIGSWLIVFIVFLTTLGVWAARETRADGDRGLPYISGKPDAYNRSTYAARSRTSPAVRDTG